MREVTEEEINASEDEIIQRETKEKKKYRATEKVELSVTIGDGRYGLIDVYLGRRRVAVKRKNEIKDEPIGTALEVKSKVLTILAFIPIGELRGDGVIPEWVSFTYKLTGGSIPLDKKCKRRVKKIGDTDKYHQLVIFEMPIEFE